MSSVIIIQIFCLILTPLHMQNNTPYAVEVLKLHAFFLWLTDNHHVCGVKYIYRPLTHELCYNSLKYFHGIVLSNYIITHSWVSCVCTITPLYMLKNTTTTYSFDMSTLTAVELTNKQQFTTYNVKTHTLKWHIG